MPSSTMIRRTRVEVDLAAIIANARTVRAVAVARALTAARAAAGFGVSLVEEGVVLRDAGVMAPVLVMGPSQHGGEDDMVMAGLTPVIGVAEAEAPALVAEAGRSGVAIIGLMTHFACADTDEPDDPDSMTRDQLRRF